MPARSQLSVPAFFLLLFACVIAGCSGKSGIKQPEWLMQGGAHDVDVGVATRHIAGHWHLNPLLSERLVDALQQSRGGRHKKPEFSPITADDGLSMEDCDEKGIFAQDKRLYVLKGTDLAVASTPGQLVFSFDSAEPQHYMAAGQAVSEDGNVNITLAEWEKGQFIIEKNGPQGLIVEKWTPAPDGSQLHVNVYYEPPSAMRPLVVNQLYDRVVDSASQAE